MKKHFRKVSSDEPTITTMVQSAASLLMAGNLDQAAALCAQALVRAPDNADAAFVLGLIKAQAREFDEALRHLDSAVELNPDDGEIASTRETVLQQLLCDRIGVAIGLHQRGLLAEAEAIYSEVLQRKPDHFDALQLLGAVSIQRRHPAVALDYLDRALCFNPAHAETHNNRGNALLDLGRFEEALASYDKALDINVANPEAHNNRGNVLRRLGRFEQALASYDGALRLRPGYAEALNNRGNALQDLGRFDEALASYDQALLLCPDHAEAWNNRGDVLRRLKRLEDARASIDKALGIKRSFAEAYNNLGNVLRDMRCPDEALSCYDHALELRPDFAEALSNRGGLLRNIGRPEEALTNLDRALVIAPDLAAAHVNRGNNLKDLNRFQEALASYDRALDLDAMNVEALTSRGNVLYGLNRTEAALDSYAQALAIRPDYAEAHWNESLVRLGACDFAVGWQKYEWRWQIEVCRDRPRHSEKPLWLGHKSLLGKTILLWAEQGLGDTIQFCRFAKQVAELGATVILEAPRSLLPVLKSLEGITVLTGEGDPLPPFDFQCPLLSLPLAIGLQLGDIRAEPYLAAPEGRAALLGQVDHRPRVGIVWSGNLKNRSGLHRSLELRDFLSALPSGLLFICLHKEIGESDRELIATHGAITTVAEQLVDFGDTAALISELDLVVTVDTSVAHLAGALGKEVWILLSATADWRWFVGREDSPWYQSAKLIRQQKLGDWASAMEFVRRGLCERYRLRDVAAGYSR